MRAVLAAAAVVVTLAVAVPRSLATFPGTNGLLAYEAQVGKRAQLFTVKMDGSGVRQLTHFTDSDAVWGEWSPNGKTIAFERDVYTGVRVSRALIESTNADGSGPHVLRPAGLNGRPSWSPEGQRIVYSTLQYGQQATISVMAANGTRVRPLLGTPLPAKGLGQGLDSPTFSPDGQRIAFVWIKKAGSAIFTITAGGGGLKQLTPWKNGVADKIDWSPDGSRIAFSSPEFGVRPSISSNVFTIRTNGTDLTRLTDSRGGKINNGLDSWSPDGKKIAFASNRNGNGNYDIYTMNANGSGVTQLTHGPQAHHAAWASHP